jgi:hypothetical protein
MNLKPPLEWAEGLKVAILKKVCKEITFDSVSKIHLRLLDLRPFFKNSRIGAFPFQYSILIFCFTHQKLNLLSHN